VYVGASGKTFHGEGALCDLAPTLLSLLELDVPAEMTGKDLLQ
jgi:2,3-bisphosphoglycerate-independent phosphoglycerate mutase